MTLLFLNLLNMGAGDAGGGSGGGVGFYITIGDTFSISRPTVDTDPYL